MSVREARFADDRWYPAAPERLGEHLSSLVEPGAPPGLATAVVSPHAGYFYSGSVAGALYGRIEVPDRVIVVGPNHRGIGSRRAVVTSGVWRIPGAEVPIDSEAAELFRQHAPSFADDASAHVAEHSLELQIPFLVHRNPGVRIVPIAVWAMRLDDCLMLGDALAQTIRGLDGPTLVVASSDMNHFAPAEIGQRKDELAIERLLALDADGLYQIVAEQDISMCGVAPAVAAVRASIQLGATHSELIRYSHSGHASGDQSSVVGYAALRFW